jgi:hypothetical protein
MLYWGHPVTISDAATTDGATPVQLALPSLQRIFVIIVYSP